MPKKIFADDSKTEEPLEIKVEEPPVKVKKPRKKRAPLSDEQKAKLVERLKLAREAKKKRDKPVHVEEEKSNKPVKKKVKEPPSPSDNGVYKKQQDELSNLRHQLEVNKLKTELENQSKSHRKIEPANPPIDNPKIEEPIVEVEVQPPVNDIPPIVPQKIRKNIAGGGNIWDKIRNSN